MSRFLLKLSAHLQCLSLETQGGITMISKMIFGFIALLMAGSVFAQSQFQPLHPPHPPTHPAPGTYFDWGRGADGTGYCYEFSQSNGQVLNGGRPVPEVNCEKVQPSYFNWGRANNGYGYCFQFTPQHLVMWQGRTVPNHQCEAVRPSHFAWAMASNGYSYCFQFTPEGLAMNEGRPVPNHYCGGH